jgi:hypothetical protein
LFCIIANKILNGSLAYNFFLLVLLKLAKSYVFLWEEKLVAPLIATPNVDKCNRRQTSKAKELGYMLHVSYLYKTNTIPFANNLDGVLVQITL